MSLVVSRINYFIFIGCAEAAKSEQFVKSNSITHIINCTSSQVQNHFTQTGVQYLTFNLLDQDSSMFFDNGVENAKSLCAFIDSAEEDCGNILIHSMLGKNRSLLVAAVYLMTKFHWKAQDAILAVSTSRRTRMNPLFEEQLINFESSVPPLKITPSLIEDDITMRNTYFNKEMRLEISPPLPSTSLKVYLSSKITEILEKPIIKPFVQSDKINKLKSILKHPRKQRVFNPIKDVKGLEKQMMQMYLPLTQAQPAFMRVSQSLILSKKIITPPSQQHSWLDESVDGLKKVKQQNAAPHLQRQQSQIQPINSRINISSCALAQSAPGLGLPQKAPQMSIPMMDAYQSCHTLRDVEIICFLEEMTYWNTAELDAALKEDNMIDQEMKYINDVDDDNNNDIKQQSYPVIQNEQQKNSSSSQFSDTPLLSQSNAYRAIRRLDHRASRIYEKLLLQRKNQDYKYREDLQTNIKSSPSLQQLTQHDITYINNEYHNKVKLEKIKAKEIHDKEIQEQLIKQQCQTLNQQTSVLFPANQSDQSQSSQQLRDQSKQSISQTPIEQIDNSSASLNQNESNSLHLHSSLLEANCNQQTNSSIQISLPLIGFKPLDCLSKVDQCSEQCSKQIDSDQNNDILDNKNKEICPNSIVQTESDNSSQSSDQQNIDSCAIQQSIQPQNNNQSTSEQFVIIHNSPQLSKLSHPKASPKGSPKFSQPKKLQIQQSAAQLQQVSNPQSSSVRSRSTSLTQSSSQQIDSSTWRSDQIQSKSNPLNSNVQRPKTQMKKQTSKQSIESNPHLQTQSPPTQQIARLSSQSKQRIGSFQGNPIQNPISMTKLKDGNKNKV